MDPELSVVVPAYNEAGRLGSTLDRISAYLVRRWPEHEIVVVDDGSTDGTAELVRAHPAPHLRLLVQPANRGKGAALRRGVLASRGARVLLCDADLSTPIEDLELLTPHLDAGAALVLGSRAVAGSRVEIHQPRHRELMGKTFNLIIRALGTGPFRDTQCGFKLLTGAAAHDLFSRLTVDGFAFDVELVWLARRRGYEVHEVGVRWRDAVGSRVNPLVDPLVMLRDVLLVRWRHRTKR